MEPSEKLPSSNDANTPVAKKDFYTFLTSIKLKIDTIVAYFCIFLVGLMTILVTYQVVTRYLFNDPSAVSEVLSRYLFIWLILIGSAYVFGLREHIAITFMRDRMPYKVRIYLEILGEFATTAFVLLVLTIGGYIGMSRQMGQLDSALQIPIGVIYAAIPISGVLSVFYCLYNQYGLVRQLSSKQKV
ncbi:MULTISPECIES: TRAP transporter small permease [Proteus]|uniref:TRAP transporter small permease protein n=1 Tax=Proteus vulgaris TaxID=585 RepID=A0A6G6SS83_PROVU|nr:TRAP transporter small permease [Proteus vulgaris]QIF95909.1 TRAP transporter small permease subunit [Proteus vulgaris]WIF72197.1 TRAP transporter small permease [Proteus vulgaris]CRL61341.1 2,3-diketo-L-gulonate TRAP transporter small permease protein YiaM [Proteus vulgaris]SUC23980.1 2,3-diketo-L-gulonate TRAP transporter small permease protein yiaM [Proteus vulgaris]